MRPLHFLALCTTAGKLLLFYLIVVIMLDLINHSDGSPKIKLETVSTSYDLGHLELVVSRIRDYDESSVVESYELSCHYTRNDLNNGSLFFENLSDFSSFVEILNHYFELLSVRL